MPLVQEPSLGPLVVSGSNDEAPVYRWFRFKEGFSADLLSNVVHRLEGDLGRDLRLLDPFCGAGTTLVSAQQLSREGFHITATGIERNPFIAFVARTKTRWPEIRGGTLIKEGERALQASKCLSPALPALSSIREGRCISKHNAKRLIAVRDCIPLGCTNSDFLLLGLASAIGQLSRARKDGRALRLVKKPRKSVEAALLERWREMATDAEAVQRTQEPCNPATVICGDGRQPSLHGISESSVDLILTSPPYPNNIDYSEVYKLELWLLGFVDNASDFLSLRYSTLCSHPTHEKTSPLPADYENELQVGSLRYTLGKLIERVEKFPGRWRARLLTRYFADIWTSLGNYHRVLRKGGVAAIVVGNSLHGASGSPFLIPTDLILARIAECQNFTVERVSVARSLKRRLSGNHFLRESLVLLKK